MSLKKRVKLSNPTHSLPKYPLLDDQPEHRQKVKNKIIYNDRKRHKVQKLMMPDIIDQEADSGNFFLFFIFQIGTPPSRKKHQILNQVGAAQ